MVNIGLTDPFILITAESPHADRLRQATITYTNRMGVLDVAICEVFEAPKMPTIKIVTVEPLRQTHSDSDVA